MNELLHVGLDVGSTTVKVVVMNQNLETIDMSYRRHFSDTKNTVCDVLTELTENYNDCTFTVALTGSGAMSAANFLDLPFIQEVVACKRAVEKYIPNTDVVIELGGEDAKIIYFDQFMEQRMNGTCAGGTGAFIDQMASLLNTDTEGLNELAKHHKTIYPIASRCGVFAKTDIQPLLNEGAAKEDIAASIFQAVVNQTISGLACGRPIRGNIAFLGGPLNYLSELRNRFIETLQLTDKTTIIPEEAHLLVAKGAALDSVSVTPISLEKLKGKIEVLRVSRDTTTEPLKPLFMIDAQYNEFTARHKKNTVEKADLKTYTGDCFIGIDAGSTTTKLVLIDREGRLLYSLYGSNEGNPLQSVIHMLKELYANLPNTADIRYSGVTGYGEKLIQTALNVDLNEIETIAHYTAAKQFLPNVTSIVDIGGQDMKYIRIKNGVIDNIMLNEACSSGCGSFIETFAKSLNLSIGEFVEEAIKSRRPVDLGSRCTVFMNSKIKQAQKEGYEVGDISAGLSYSVIKNAIQKVMKVRDTKTLGDHIVVQGGTFYNDAILRAFELIVGKEVVRPDISGLMGAYGAALLAKEQYEANFDLEYHSRICKLEELDSLEIAVSHTRCNGCENHCLLTINKFSNGKKHISGNRCEKGAGIVSDNTNLPNLMKYKFERIFGYTPLDLKDAPRGTIGIPRVLNMYEDYPFWFTFFTNLGFRVILSEKSNRKTYEKGMESMPSESVCYPAKLAHGHMISLLESGIKTIFYPCIPYSRKEYEKADNHYNCPIVISYSEVLKNNVEELNKSDIKFLNPFLPLEPKNLTKRILELEEFKEYQFSKKELLEAATKAEEEYQKSREDIHLKGKETLDYIEKNNLKGIVLSGRPYHVDPEINHGIDTLINSLGLVVLTEDSICFDEKDDLKLRVVDQWTYHSRVYHAANVVCKNKRLELVSLNSFGCGLDAIITDQTEEILKKNHRLYTTIKIDETSNLGAIKIRLRSLIASMNKRLKTVEYTPYQFEKNYFKKEMKERNTILCPDMSPFHMPLLVEALNAEGYHLEYLSEMNDKMLDNGLKYVNNDACYPSLIVIGQLLSALQSGKYDLEHTTVLISQTGGGCRATNYIGLIRKALKDAGFGHVPILSFNVSGLEKEQEFKITMSMANRALMAVVLSDLLMKLLYATRPYEKIKGQSTERYQQLLNECKSVIKSGKRKELNYQIKKIIQTFQAIPTNQKRLPKVGIVGEILIKYHHYGNHDLANTLEKEGCEVFVPELMGFVKYCVYNQIAKIELLGGKKTTTYLSKQVLNIIDYYERTVKKELAGTKYRSTTNIYQLAKNVEPILSKGNQTGEGWVLTAEMIELIEDGVNNIVCVQPFACLPNHIVGKSVIKKIKELYPYANIVAIDYDPGSSESNQINRLKLMLSVAKDNLSTKE